MKRVVLSLGIALGAAGLHAQENTSFVFHSYSNLIQIPVLALDDRFSPVPPDTPPDFSVSIDSGPPFPAPHVRLEGDDPIALAILLDLSGDQNDIRRHLDDTIASLAQSLNPQDRVSLYALDCQLIRTAEEIPPDAVQLKSAVDAAIHSPVIHGVRKKDSECGHSLHLWDALAYVTSELAKQPGRRVLLANTDGRDKGSTHPWKELREYANNSGVAIFGMASVPYIISRGDFSVSSSGPNKGYEDDFRSLCELSGGIVRTVNPVELTVSFENFIKRLRGRYIVEFPRPDTLEEGPHDFLVTTTNLHYFIRPAGASLPIADAATLTDPNTLPSDPTHAPSPGSRKILKPAH